MNPKIDDSPGRNLDTALSPAALAGIRRVLTATPERGRDAAPVGDEHLDDAVRRPRRASDPADDEVSP